MHWSEMLIALGDMNYFSDRLYYVIRSAHILLQYVQTWIDTINKISVISKTCQYFIDNNIYNNKLGLL